jgi:hypothetical protein
MPPMKKNPKTVIARVLPISLPIRPRSSHSFAKRKKPFGVPTLINMIMIWEMTNRAEIKPYSRRASE